MSTTNIHSGSWGSRTSPEGLPGRLRRKSLEAAARYVERRLAEGPVPEDERLILSLDKLLRQGPAVARLATLTPPCLVGASWGFALPDWDITLLGIGWHRFFLFHSALGVAGLQYLYRRRNANNTGPASRISGMALGGLAMGVGLHLTVDLFQPKSIVFPGKGTAVSGTLVDDNLWLLLNAIWAYRIGFRLMREAAGEDGRLVKRVVARRLVWKLRLAARGESS